MYTHQHLQQPREGAIGALGNYKAAFRFRQSISCKLKSPLFIWLDSQNRVEWETKLEVENSSELVAPPRPQEEPKETDRTSQACWLTLLKGEFFIYPK